MKNLLFPTFFCVLLLALSSCQSPAPRTGMAAPREEANNIRTYLSEVAKEITDNTLSETSSLSEWQNQRPQRYDEFIEMMGLQDMPLEGKRPDLNITHTGTIQEDGYRIEKLYYESLPGLYVPANLYIPDELEEP